MSAAPLLSTHQDAGAVFAEDPECQEVLNYGDTDSEYRTVVESAGITDRSLRGKLRVTGSDRERFLHGMLTNTVEGLVSGQGNYTAMTTPQGHTLTDLVVIHRGEEIFLETEPGYQDKLRVSLEKFLIADDVTLEDVSGNFAIIGLQGPAANQVISAAAGQTFETMSQFDSVDLHIGSLPIVVVCHSYTGENGYEIWTLAEDAADVWRDLANSGAEPVGCVATDVLRVEAGIPRYGLDFDERVMPLEAGIASAVDFEKGCFIGQEALAKMHNLGKPRRYLCGLVIAGSEPAPRETEIFVDGKEVGWTTSSLLSIYSDECVAFASLRRGFHEVGQLVALGDGKSGRVVKLPFRPTAIGSE